MDSADEWKRFYSAERAMLGAGGLERLLADAPSLVLPGHGALIVPHTRLQVTGSQIAAAATSIVESGAERVLMLGVLHGARRCDAGLVAAARSGEATALATLRGVHDEAGHAAEEFSLDALTELVEMAAARAGRRVDIVRRYPFLVGDDPESLPGMAELQSLVDDGCVLVATTDPMHHGAGYGTPIADRRSETEAQTLAWVSSAIEAELAALSDHYFADFQRLAAADRSDFRDTGPVLALLLGPSFTWTIHDVALVDYSATLNAPAPTWVAGALITTTRA